MEEDHEIMSDEELKQFFLNEAMLLCHSARLESGECEKLWILHNRLKRMNKLLGYLHHQDLGMNLLELQEVLFRGERGNEEKETPDERAFVCV